MKVTNVVAAENGFDWHVFHFCMHAFVCIFIVLRLFNCCLSIFTIYAYMGYMCPGPRQRFKTLAHDRRLLQSRSMGKRGR